MVILHELVGPQCQALNLSDGQRCVAEATAHDNLFCHFHAKQCFGLYMGYKRRNAELDALAAQEPPFLHASKASLASQTFKSLASEPEVHAVHEYLFQQYVLLGKVISARKLHHKHFFSLEMDYGHKAYLDKLVSTRHSVLKALENLERRTAELLYEKENWYSWVRQVQDNEDQNREKEQKKVKLEAALFRRHWREMEMRLAAAREKEEQRRQEVYLDEAWKERMMAQPDAEDAAWDPIEDVFDEDRERYLDLIRHFLWMEVAEAEKGAAAEKGEVEEKGVVELDGLATAAAPPGGALAVKDHDEEATTGEETAAAVASEQPSSQAKKPKKRGGKKKNKTKQTNDNPIHPPKLVDAARLNQKSDKSNQEQEPSKTGIESKDEIRKRLREGIEKDYSHINGPMIVGTALNPPELLKRTAPVKDEDITQLISEITEIKMLLFCRQIMSHSALLPAALRANSVEEFLSDPSIADSDLRDLCLQVEQPTLQALRDACADFTRGDAPDDDEEEQPDAKVDLRSAAEFIRHQIRYDDLEPHFLLRALETAYKGKPIPKELQDAVKNGSEPADKKIKVRICGRSIWNHASQRSMARDGWLQFSIMAKDCSFEDAIGLCRNWDEFFEIHLLSLWQYFPASKWTGWSGNALTEELTQMGFIPFHMNFSAEENTTYSHLPSMSRKNIRRQQIVVESRNAVCAYMKRNDPFTHRFIQYAKMRSCEFFILVRDGKDGRIITAPDRDQRWIRRSRRGISATGPSRYEDNWDVEIDVGPLFFDIAELSRKWHFNFDSYYEVYIWDFIPGRPAIDLYHHLRDTLSKARRIKTNRGKYAHMKYIMETLTREPDSKRVRQLKPGEDSRSLYDELCGPDAEFWMKTTNTAPVMTKEDITPGVSPYLYYNDTDAAEDAVLFEEEMLKGFPQDMPFAEIKNPIQQLESSRLPLSVLNKRVKELEEKMAAVLENPFGFKRLEGKETRVSTSTDTPFMSDLQPYEPGSDQFPYSVPPIWEQAYKIIEAQDWDDERKDLRDRIEFDFAELAIPEEELGQMADTQEIMERERAYVYKDSFHLADLEPGAQERYKEAMKLIIGGQKYQSPNPHDHIHWAWFCMELLDWMNLELCYDEYSPEPISPWPHRYIAHDIVQAFMMMGLFFPNVKETSIIQEYLGTEEGKAFKDSKLFDAAARSAKRPDVRTSRSTNYRPKSFWNEWYKHYNGDEHWLDAYPWDWAMTIRPIIAKPPPRGPQIRASHPKTSPPIRPPPHLVRPALLPLMMTLPSRPSASFIDPVGRAWEWKFIPKDMALSEWSIHNTLMLRLGYLREQMMGLGLGGSEFMTPADKERGKQWAHVKYSGQDKWRHGRCELDERVVQRGIWCW
ncbi:hypothetical protein N0V88_002224 [Collariella sp. IMI 366227]|nr:hypothetical protein N0V88_002224 [Collariella sp. IMI 366227]